MGNKMSLHDALEVEDFERFIALLKEPNGDINATNAAGDTPLIACLKKENSNLACNCIKAKCNVNMPNDTWTPLHYAVTTPKLFMVALSLIQEEADVNARGVHSDVTPLHVAVEYANIEAVHLLLYYGADVHLVANGVTPLMRAAGDGQFTLVKLLFNWYDDLSSLDGWGLWNEIVEQDSSDPFEEDEADVDRSMGTGNGVYPLCKALFQNNYEMFKLFWSKADHTMFFTAKPLLFYFLVVNVGSNWLKCLYEVLSSPFAVDIVDDLASDLPIVDDVEMSVLCCFSHVFLDEGIEAVDRVTVIFLLAAAGMEVTQADLFYIFEKYGSGPELEACIYAGNLNAYLLHPCTMHHEFVCHILRRIDTPQQDMYLANMWIEAFRMGLYFAKVDKTKALKNIFVIGWKEVDINTRIPTLFNMTCKAIARRIENCCTLKKSYHYHDMVKQLPLLEELKNILLLRNQDCLTLGLEKLKI